MIVHLYAQCWNDEWMLPFFFRHYDAIVDEYFIFDDGSTDGTWSILRGHPRVQAERFVRSAADSFVFSEQAFSNQCWKRSRGFADWVIVTDVDEHLFHPEGRDYLSRCTSEGVTMIPALGFQMISETRPEDGETLCLTHTIGACWVQMMKASIFNPDTILEMNYSPGRHVANPIGDVKVPRRDEMLLLHYKYMGFAHTHRRHQQLRLGLGSRDMERGWGHRYSWSEDQLKDDWQSVATAAIDTAAIRDDPEKNYPIPAWWEKYRS